MIKKLVDSVTRRQKQAPLLELCGCVPPLVFAQFKKSAILHHPNFALFDLLLVAIFVGGKEKHSSSPLLLSPSLPTPPTPSLFKFFVVGLAYQGKDIVVSRFIIDFILA
jgi:hypothetical protein